MTTRTRNRTTQLTMPPFTWTAWDNSVGGIWRPETTRDNSSETIIDDVTRLPRGKFRPSRNVLHTLWVAQYTGGTHLHSWDGGSHWFIIDSMGYEHARTIGPRLASYGAPAVDWRSYSYEAMQKMGPELKPDLSLVNFILELKDLKRIPDIWSRKRKLLKNVTNAHLNVSFGIKPLLQDLSNLYTALSTLRSRLQALIDNQGKVVRKHYSRPLLPGSTTMSSAYQVGPYGYYGFAQDTITELEVKYTATAVFSYRLPKDITAVRRELDAWLDVLGVRLDPGIVWNAIPFSFVIDWFFNVGDWLESLSPDNMKIELELVDFCHSIKRTVTSVTRKTSAFGEAPAATNAIDTPGTGSKILQEDFSYYKRERAVPASSPRLRWKGLPSWGTIALGGSLLHSLRS